MKAVLEFNLEDQDDDLAHNRCIKSRDMALALWDFDQYLRGAIKFGNDLDALKHRDKLHEILQDKGIIFDNLIN
jgi:hypothetical protein